MWNWNRQFKRKENIFVQSSEKKRRGERKKERSNELEYKERRKEQEEREWEQT